MTGLSDAAAKWWVALGTRFMPFADAVTPELPLPRLLRLSLFQVSVGMAIVLVIGTLNRVMIVELGVPAWLVALMVSLPLVFAPFRAVVGFRSDTHRSVLGWRRVPYLWMGTMLQFGGLAMMPFALLVLSGGGQGPVVYGQIGAGLAFLLTGAGLHTVQTVGLALATDLAPPKSQPRVVALLCVTLLVGMVASAVLFGLLLASFSPMRLIQVVQGAGLATVILNLVALWKQEARDPARTATAPDAPTFRRSWQAFVANGGSRRRLVAVGLGTVAFSLQDILLEPYGGQILHLPVAATTSLTAMLAVGGVAGLALAARRLGKGADPFRVAALGALAGLLAFAAVIFAAPLGSLALFAGGTALIGFGGGLFAAGTLTDAVGLAPAGRSGLALGTWGAVQASAAGVAIAAGGGLRDAVSSLAERGALGPVLTDPATGYLAVYHLEIVLLFATLVAIGPLVRTSVAARPDPPRRGPRLATPPAEVTRMLPTAALTGYIDVAQVTLYAFWLFFAGLIFYLRREDKREGYPLDSDRYSAGGRVVVQGFPPMPRPKRFLKTHGGTYQAPSGNPDRRELAAEPLAPWPGAPLMPTGNPMIDGIGPASYALRDDEPDLTYDGEPRIVPMRVAPDFAVSAADYDPRGMEVVGADGRGAGIVRELWVDRSEPQILFLETELTGGAGGRPVLVPMRLARLDAWRRQMKVHSILSHQFADVPRTRNPDGITRLEEDKITAYFAGGKLYATPGRLFPGL